MRKAEILTIACKVLGIYLILTNVIETLNSIVMLAMFSAQTKSDFSVPIDYAPYFFVASTSFLLLLIVSLALIFKTNLIVKLISKKSDYEENVRLFAEPKSLYELSIVTTALI